MTSNRWWLSLAYLLATLMAQGPHDHGQRAGAAESRDDCDNLGRHVAGHETPPSHEAPASCPACHFRAESPAWGLAPRPVAGPGIAIPPETSRPSTRPGSPLRACCRAPPRD